MTRKPLHWSLAIALLFEMSYFMVTPLVPLYLTNMGVSAPAIGSWLAWAAAIPAVLALYLGRMADRLGHTRALLAGAAIVAASSAGLALARAPWLASVCLGLLYLGDATVVIANQVYLGSLGAPEERVRHYGWFGAAMNVGAMVGPVVGGLLADWRGPWLSFALVAAIAAASLTVLPLLPPIPGLGGAASTPPAGSVWRHSSALLSVRVIQYAMLAMMLIQLGSGARNSYYPLYLAGVGLTPTLVGLLFSIHSLAGVTMRALMGWLSDRLGNHRLMLAAVATCAVSLALTPTSSLWLVQGALAASLGAAHSVIQPLTNAVLVEQVSPQDRGLVFGLRMSLQRGVGVLVPLILGSVAGGFGVGAPMLVAGLIMAAGLLPLERLQRRSGLTAAPAAASR